MHQAGFRAQCRAALRYAVRRAAAAAVAQWRVGVAGPNLIGNVCHGSRPFSNRGARVKFGVKLAFAGVMVLSGVGCPPHDGCQGCDAARCEAI